jgi:hypothetical protein
MCQMCDEADAYLAEIEARAKKVPAAQKLARTADAPHPQSDRTDLGKSLSKAQES